MKLRLASLREGGRDGTLVVVSADGERYARSSVPTLQAALDEWAEFCSGIGATLRALDAGDGTTLDWAALHAPLPRAFQYCEGSSYLSHMERCRAARHAELPAGYRTNPAVLQGASDRFLAPTEPIELGDEEWGLDLEATVAVILGDVPIGCDEHQAAAAIRLVVLVNDLTLRNVLVVEAANGLGFFQAKPIRALAPFALTPQALGDAWDGGLLRSTVRCSVNGELLGELQSGDDASFDFPTLIAHAARTRPLAAGTILGSGTISNVDAARGFGCLAEKRAMEAGPSGPTTQYLRHGARVRIEAFDSDDRSIFGPMDAAITRPKGARA